MMSPNTASLPVILSKTLSQDVQPNLVRFCPTMDLIALATRDERVEVLRLSGQRAFGVQRKGKNVQVVSLCWKYNGQYLAVSWSDGVVDVVSSESGNALQNFRHVTVFNDRTSVEHAGGDGTISCLGWGLSLLDTSAGRAKVNVKHDGEQERRPWKTKISLDDFLEREPNLEKIDMPTDLPEQLTNFDATDLMPKLPVLPALPASAYKSGQPSLSEMFASQTLLDSALHRGPSKELNALNSFLLSNSNGSIRLIVYDSLSIGNISFPGLSRTSNIQHLKHYSHPFTHCHVMLSRIQVAPGQFCMALVPISLRFLRNSGRNIHFIDYKTAQLDTLVQYIGESILAVQYQWKHCQELPSRFQANIEEDLAERKEPNLRQSLFQLAATGYCSPKMSEWLKDELAERGHKRWDQAVSQGYVKVLELVQENLIPAVDRCSAVLTNLQGLAQYYEHSPAFDVPNASFNSIQDIIRCVRVIAHHILLFASEEQRRFASFSRWLRIQIDIQASDPTSAAGQELLERDAGVNFTLVLSYIEITLQKSRLDTFLHDVANDQKIQASPEVYAVLCRNLEAYKADKVFEQNILNISAYHREWVRLNMSLLEHITSWQRANVFIPGALMLTASDSKINAVRMVSNVAGIDSSTCTYVATVDVKNTANLSLYRIGHSEVFDDVPKSIETCDGLEVIVSSGEILDLKFENDTNMLVLVDFEHAVKFVRIPFGQSDSDSLQFAAVDISPAQMRWPSGRNPKIKARLELSAEMTESFTIAVFPKEESFLPKSIEVTATKGRRVCVLVGQDLRQLIFLALEASTNDDERQA